MRGKRRKRGLGSDESLHYVRVLQEAQNAIELGRDALKAARVGDCLDSQGVLASAERYIGRADAHLESSGESQPSGASRDAKKTLFNARKELNDVDDVFRKLCVRDTRR